MNLNRQVRNFVCQELHRRKMWVHELSLYDLSSLIDPMRTLNTAIYDLENEAMRIAARQRAMVDALLLKLEEIDRAEKEGLPEVTA